MNNYLNYNHYIKIDEFCKNKCIEIIKTEKNKDTEYLNKGMYKGFLYTKKLNKYLYKNRSRSFKQYELYNIIKNQIKEVMNIYSPKKRYIEGMKKSLYECLNFVSSLN